MNDTFHSFQKVSTQPGQGQTEYRRVERALYSWCLQRFAGTPQDVADAEAVERYPSINDIRFHDEAWHWAMLKVFGAHYWVSRPELAKPSKEYAAYSEALQDEGPLDDANSRKRETS